MKKPWIAIGLIAALAGAGLAIYYRTHRPVDQADDRRKWLQNIDAENAKAGFVKDTNGNLIYVGTTNGHSSSN